MSERRQTLFTARLRGCIVFSVCVWGCIFLQFQCNDHKITPKHTCRQKKTTHISMKTRIGIYKTVEDQVILCWQTIVKTIQSIKKFKISFYRHKMLMFFQLMANVISFRAVCVCHTKCVRFTICLCNINKNKQAIYFVPRPGN